MNAHELLTAVQAAGIPALGLSLGDVADPQTWRFDGELTTADLARAVVIVTATMAPAAPVPDPLAIRVTRLEQWLTDMASQVATLQAALPVSAPTRP